MRPRQSLSTTSGRLLTRCFAQSLFVWNSVSAFNAYISLKNTFCVYTWSWSCGNLQMCFSISRVNGITPFKRTKSTKSWNRRTNKQGPWSLCNHVPGKGFSISIPNNRPTVCNWHPHSAWPSLSPAESTQNFLSRLGVGFQNCQRTMASSL